MRITREYVFDMIELVGKAVQTARKRKAGPEWDMDEQLEIFARKWSLKLDPVDEAIRKEAQAEDDQFGLFAGSDWQDSADDGVDGAVDERENRRQYSQYGSEAFEQRRAQRPYDAHGDAVSCRLWELQRQLRFKILGVQDVLKELQSLCDGLSRYISAGWANRLAHVLDTCSRG